MGSAIGARGSNTGSTPSSARISVEMGGRPVRSSSTTSAGKGTYPLGLNRSTGTGDISAAPLVHGVVVRSQLLRGGGDVELEFLLVEVVKIDQVEATLVRWRLSRTWLNSCSCQEPMADDERPVAPLRANLVKGMLDSSIEQIRARVTDELGIQEVCPLRKGIGTLRTQLIDAAEAETGPVFDPKVLLRGTDELLEARLEVVDRRVLACLERQCAFAENR